MLTIREPISLKTDRPIQGIRQDMAERMQANYGLMNLAIRKEELLHITSQPAEIYFAEGENFNILTNINNQNQQEIRLDIINNLMNRILVAQTENFTYQDTVYISNVLRKLGIRDEKTFMKQVFALQKEHKETRQLLQKYEANQEILQQLFQSENEREKSVTKEKETIREKERRYFIHDEIFKRLETGKIYQDMRSFSKNYTHESRQIYPGEMQVAEQTKSAQSLLLQKIKNEITGGDTSLYYLHNNRYEYLQEMTEEVTQELEEQISAAILLNLAEQTYVLRQQQIEENNHYWYSIAASLFQTAENTWKRYEANLMERKHFSTQMNQVLEQVHQTKHLEGDVISNIVEAYYQNMQQWKEENELRQSLLVQRNIQEDKSQEISISGGSYHLTQEEFELNFLQTEEKEEEAGETEITVEQLQKQLEIFNQRNYENYRKITEIERGQQTIRDRKVDRRKAQMDALRALERPEEVLREYITSDRTDPVTEAQRKAENQIYELFSEETKEIYRQFLSQNSSTEHTFLQHIMAQPEESEIRREVVQALEQIEQKQIVYEHGQDTSMKEDADGKEKKERASVVEEFRKYFDIYNSKKEENYRSITEIEEQKIYVKDSELVTLQDILQILKQPNEILLEDFNGVKRESLREIEKKLVTGIYDYFSEETKEIYRQFLSRNFSTEHTFLQHIMAQPEESETRREVVQALEQIEKQEEFYKTQREEIESVKYRKPVVSQSINEEVHQQLILWKELQETSQSVLEEEEVFLQEGTREVIHTQETKLLDLRENIEKQIKRQQAEISVMNINTQKEIRSQQIEFVHKVEEKQMNDELLEEIRMQNQRTVKTEQMEETNLQNTRVIHQAVQETVNRVQTNRMEDIEEIVQKSVKRQMNQLSEQVYGKLEKKLQTERKRRGYF